MRYLSPQFTPAETDSQVYSTPDYASMLSVLATQVQRVQLQMDEMQQRLELLEVNSQREIDFLIPRPPAQPAHGPLVTIALKSIKWLFLLLFGFAIAAVLSAGLRAPTEVMVVLRLLLDHWFIPLVTLTFGAVAIAVVLESLK